MLMKWEDLKVGDILEFNPEFIKMGLYYWVPHAIEDAPDFFHIIKIVIEGDTIHLDFDWYLGSWSINKSGAIWSDISGPSVFKVVSLTED